MYSNRSQLIASVVKSCNIGMLSRWKIAKNLHTEQLLHGVQKNLNLTDGSSIVWYVSFENSAPEGRYLVLNAAKKLKWMEEPPSFWS